MRRIASRFRRRAARQQLRRDVDHARVDCSAVEQLSDRPASHLFKVDRNGGEAAVGAQVRQDVVVTGHFDPVAAPEFIERRSGSGGQQVVGAEDRVGVGRVVENLSQELMPHRNLILLCGVGSPVADTDVPFGHVEAVEPGGEQEAVETALVVVVAVEPDGDRARLAAAAADQVFGGFKPAREIIVEDAARIRRHVLKTGE